jgi:RimJ/RimL family protein N-acetyltransferase
MTHAAAILNTARARLRKPAERDRAAAAVFMASDRSRFMGGPYEPPQALAALDEVLAAWELRGFGLMAITLTADDRAVGLAGPWQPADYAEPEIGWNLWDVALEGRGLATEAVRATRDWAFGAVGLPTAVSYINVENAASARLAARVGARPDPDAFCPFPPPVLIFRHRPEWAA